MSTITVRHLPGGTEAPWDWLARVNDGQGFRGRTREEAISRLREVYDRLPADTPIVSDGDRASERLAGPESQSR